MQHTKVVVVEDGRGKAAWEQMKYEDLGKNGVKCLNKGKFFELYLNFRNVRRGARAGGGFQKEERGNNPFLHPGHGSYNRWMFFLTLRRCQ